MWPASSRPGSAWRRHAAPAVVPRTSEPGPTERAWQTWSRDAPPGDTTVSAATATRTMSVARMSLFYVTGGAIVTGVQTIRRSSRIARARRSGLNGLARNAVVLPSSSIAVAGLRVVAGHEEHANVRLALDDLARQGRSVAAWHDDVGEHQVERFGGAERKRFFGIARFDDVVAARPENVEHEASDRVVVLDEKDAFAACTGERRRVLRAESEDRAPFAAPAMPGSRRSGPSVMSTALLELIRTCRGGMRTGLASMPPTPTLGRDVGRIAITGRSTPRARSPRHDRARAARSSRRPDDRDVRPHSMRSRLTSARSTVSPAVAARDPVDVLFPRRSHDDKSLNGVLRQRAQADRLSHRRSRRGRLR